MYILINMTNQYAQIIIKKKNNVIALLKDFLKSKGFLNTLNSRSLPCVRNIAQQI